MGAPAGNTVKADSYAPRRTQFIVFMVVAVVTSCFADISLKHGLSLLVFPPFRSILDAFQCLRMVLTNPWTVGGIVLIVVDFTAFFRALRLGPLSVVIPLRSITYVLTSLLAYGILGEPIPPVRWMALGLILIGVCLVGRTAMKSR